MKNTLGQYQQELANRLPHSKGRDSFGDECVKLKKERTATTCATGADSGGA